MKDLMKEDMIGGSNRNCHGGYGLGNILSGNPHVFRTTAIMFLITISILPMESTTATRTGEPQTIVMSWPFGSG